jgi:hypothetical protein
MYRDENKANAKELRDKPDKKAKAKELRDKPDKKAKVMSLIKSAISLALFNWAIPDYSLYANLAVVALLISEREARKKKNSEKKISALLSTYPQKKTHPSFGKVVVVIKGDKDACIEKTIRSVLNQNIKVDEISTCDNSDISSNVCKKVVNIYSDHYNVGIERATFERLLDADTIAVFLRCGDVLPSRNYISKALDSWSLKKPYEHKNPYTLVISEAQLDSTEILTMPRHRRVFVGR